MPDDLSASPLFYTLFGDPNSQQDAASQTISFAYTDLNINPFIWIFRILSQITDELGRVIAYTINGSTGVRTGETVTDPLTSEVVRTTLFSYASGTLSGFMTQKTIQDGVATGADLVVAYAPDDYGYVATETVGGIAETQYINDKNGNRISLEDPNENVTTFGYDGLNRLISVTNPDATYRTITYDGAGNKITETDENRNEMDYTYDLLNRLSTSTRLMGSGPSIAWQYEYNAVNSKTKETDPNGKITNYTYDSLQRLTTKTDAMSNEWQYDYSGGNAGSAVFNTSTFQPTMITNPSGTTYAAVTTNTYDALYRLTKKSVNYGGSTPSDTNYGYDYVSNLTSVEDPVHNTTSFTPDALRRVIEVDYADGTSTQTSYTPAGLVLTETDQASSVTTHAYDAIGRRTDTWLPDPSSGTKTGNSPHTQMGYDNAGNMTSLTDPMSNETTYAYDNRNRRITVTQPVVSAGTPVTNTTYDGVGNVLTVEDPNGNTTAMAYDNANRVTTTTYPGGAATTRSYDANGNVLVFTDENGHTTTNTYDALNHLLTTTTDVLDIIQQYAYDQVGNRSQVTDGMGFVTAYTYDGLNRLLATTYDYGTAKAATITNAYDALNLTSRADALEAMTTYAYDQLNRIASVSYPIGADSLTYARDPVGNVLSVTHASAGPRDVTHAYDKLNRVLTEKSNGSSQTHTYDATWNRLTTVYGETGRLLTYSYDALNRPLGSADTWPTLYTDILAWWSLNETSGARADSTGNGYTLADNNSVGSATGKVYPNGALFDGTNYLSTAGLSFNGLSSFSIAFWFNPSSFTTTPYPGLVSDRTSTNWNIQILVVSGTLYLFLGSATLQMPVSGTISPSNWYFVAATWDGSTATLSINNGTPATGTYTGLLNATGNPVIVGGTDGAGGSTGALDGTMDAVGIWSRALSASEITELYNGGSGLALY